MYKVANTGKKKAGHRRAANAAENGSDTKPHAKNGQHGEEKQRKTDTETEFRTYFQQKRLCHPSTAKQNPHATKRYGLTTQKVWFRTAKGYLWEYQSIPFAARPLPHPAQQSRKTEKNAKRTPKTREKPQSNPRTKYGRSANAI